jgi:hypothetical protein
MADVWKVFGITIIVLIIIISGILIFSYLSRECNRDSDCPANEFCAGNYKCTPLPSVDRSSDITSSIILGIAIIASALIIRNSTVKPKNNL